MKKTYFKKLIILGAFVVFSVLAGSASACTIYDEGCNRYEDHLPQIYGNNYTGQGQNYPVYQNPQGAYYAVSNYQQPQYIPQAPIVMSNDSYTGQNYGGTSSTTNTAGNTSSQNENSDENPGLLSSIFGNKSTAAKKNTFSNGSETIEADQNLQALVNSKGLAMGTNNGLCGTTQKEDYLILYKNITGVTVTNVAIRMSLPTGITPTNTSGGSYSERDNTVTFFIGVLAPDQTGQILLPVKKTGTIEGVARSEMVYTLPNQNQNMVVAYAFGNGTCAQSVLGASAIGSGNNLFGGTLLGWIFLALLVGAFIYLFRFFLLRKQAHHGGDGHGHGH